MGKRLPKIEATVFTIGDLIEFCQKHNVPSDTPVGTLIEGDRGPMIDGDLSHVELTTFQGKPFLDLGGFGSIYPEPD